MNCEVAFSRMNSKKSCINMEFPQICQVFFFFTFDLISIKRKAFTHANTSTHRRKNLPSDASKLMNSIEQYSLYFFCTIVISIDHHLSWSNMGYIFYVCYFMSYSFLYLKCEKINGIANALKLFLLPAFIRKRQT